MKFLKKWWLTAFFITLTVVSMATIIIPSSITSRNSLSGLAKEIMVNISSYTLDKSENYLLPAEKAAELTRFLADSKIVSSNTPQSMINYFYQQLELYPQFTSVYYGNIRGEFFMASRSSAKVDKGFYTKIIEIKNNKRKVGLIWTDPERNIISKKNDPEDKYDPRQRPWFIDAVMNNDVVWTAPYLFYTGNKPGITTASPVYNKRGVLQGVVGVDISIEELSVFLNKLTIGQRGKAFIVNSSGDVVAFPDLDELKQIGQDGQKIRLSKINELKDSVTRKAFASLNLPPDQLPHEPVFTSFTHADEIYSAMFTPFKDSQWPWIIGIYIPENDYLGGIKNSRNINIFIAMFVVMLAGATGWVIARKLENTKTEAIRANKAKSRFLAVMSHEIRTPMNVILGATDLLKDSTPRDNQKPYIKLLNTAGTGLLDLLNDILDMSKIEAGLLELENISFNPKALLNECCSVFSFAAQEKGIELKLEIEQDFPDTVQGDPVRIKQVIINLIGNAVKFTSSGGVYIHAYCTCSIPDNKLNLIIKVRDTGPGIPEEQLEAVFENFVQADKSITREHSGTGLGLSISKSISQIMGGDIELESIQGKGSTFTFSAPLNVESQSACPVRSNRKTNTENKSPRKVLLIEDNKSNRELVTHYLKDSPHIIETASNGEHGVRKYKEILPDIVFMDIEMPVMDGYEATRHIRIWEKESGYPQVPIIALSAHAIKGTEEAVLKAGCSGYMTKPVTKLQLLDRIERKR